jgi:peptidoglycan hydrolase-like protein with peptidoglycan-binding domain
VQSALNRIEGAGLPVDGKTSAAARSAVRRFQRRRRLPADGIVGPETEQALREARRRAQPQPEPARGAGEIYEFETLDLESASSMPTLRQGSRGSVVIDLQRRLAAAGFSPGTADGIFGPLTDTAVRAFQSARRLTVDGIVGPQTWAALYAQAAPAPSSPRTPAPSYWGSRRDIQLKVPFRGWQDKEGCFNRCTEMAAAVGVRVGGPDAAIKVAISEDTLGGLTIDRAKAREGIAYIDEQLEAGRPVVVGVSYRGDYHKNLDGGITDHFVIITRRGTHVNRGVYYGYHDPATSDASIGTDQNIANRFYSTADGGLSRPAAAPYSVPLWASIYGMSLVRRNE